MFISSLILVGNAVLLGIRHGVDWDHIAAIADIVGTVSATTGDAGAISVPRHKDALRLSSCYAIGHATIVLVLGLAALMFATVLPEWIDPLMEKAVGITLLALGIWIFYSIMRQPAAGEEYVLQSRWMFILAKISQAGNWLYSRITGKPKPLERTISQYNAPAAFGIGVIHGFGAETGTQVLLIAAVGGSSTHLLGALILLSFISGLVISNTFVAILACAGFIGSARFKPLLIASSVLTGVFSLIIGTLFASGYGSILPDLQH